MRKDVLWLVALLVVVGVGLRLAQSKNDVDEVGATFQWEQTFKSGDRWSFTVTRTADSAEIRGTLIGTRGQKASSGRISVEEYRALMAGIADGCAWSLDSTPYDKGPIWTTRYKLTTPLRTHRVHFTSAWATPEHLALARYIDMENPITSGQLGELSKGERAISDALFTYFNDVINSKMGPPP